MKADARVATARVIRRAHDPRLQAEVADELGISTEVLATVVAEAIPDTHLVEVKADIADAALAARVVNAIARKLADEFKSDTEIQVRVVDTATPPKIGMETGE